MRSKKALANFTTSFLLMLFSVISGLIIPRMIIGSFGSNVYGLVASISQFLSYIILLEAGVGGVVRAALYKPLAENNMNKISGIMRSTERFFKGLGLIFIAYLIVISLLYPFIVKSEFESLYTFSLVLIIGISTFVQYYFGISYQILLNADQRQYFDSLIQIVTVIVNTILVIVLIKSGAGIHLVKAGSALIFIVRPFVLRLYIFKKYGIDRKAAYDEGAIKQKWDGFGHHVAFLLHNNSAVVLITFLLNMGEVAVYSVYYLIISSVQKLVATFSSGLEAAFGNIIAKNENESLKRNFAVFELVSFSLVTVSFTCTALLILPFIKIYTAGISDVEYLRPSFAYILTAALAMYCIRIPYQTVVLAAGHYRQTRNGAFAEAFINAGFSAVLIILFGITGAAAGAFFAIVFRTIQYASYLSSNIMIRSLKDFFIKTAVYSFSSMLIFIIGKCLPLEEISNYKEWILNSAAVISIAALIVMSANLVFFRRDFNNLVMSAKNISILRNFNGWRRL